MVFFLMACCILLALESGAQGAVRFHSITQIGFLYGDTEKLPLLQSVNGIRYKRSSAGIGLGLDYYFTRSSTLFVHLQQDVLSGSSSPFFYAAIGSAMPVEKKVENELSRSEYERGLYYDLGIGYRCAVGEKLSLHFNLGYTRKEVHETRWSRFNFPQDEAQYFDYSFRRISFKLGLGWND